MAQNFNATFPSLGQPYGKTLEDIQGTTPDAAEQYGREGTMEVVLEDAGDETPTGTTSITELPGNMED